MAYTVTINIGDLCTLKTDHEKLPRICTGISIRKNSVTYELNQGASSSWHYDFEVEAEKKQIIIGFKNEKGN